MTTRRYSISVLSSGGKSVIEGESWVFKDSLDCPPGKIYFVPFLDLADSYLAVSRAKAIVVAKGGALSHVAIIGRELGITVVRLDDPSIPEGIGDGRRIRIDIEKGVLEVVE